MLKKSINSVQNSMQNLKSIPAFDDWQGKLNKNDRLPRGQYFKEKQFTKVLLMSSKNQVFDLPQLEFSRAVRAFTPPITISQRRNDFYEGNVLKVLDSQSGKKRLARYH